MQGPVDVLAGIQPHILRHTGQEEVMHAPLLRDGDGLSLQVADGLHHSVPNSSKQPTWTPPRMTIGAPTSTWMMQSSPRLRGSAPFSMQGGVKERVGLPRAPTPA